MNNSISYEELINCQNYAERVLNFYKLCNKGKLPLNADEAEMAVREYNRINSLLAIISLEEMTDDELLKFGANTDYHEGIFNITFDNGSSLNFDLCSGQSNYWDDVVWTSADGKRDICFDCEFELGNIEFEVDNELYIVEIVKI